MTDNAAPKPSFQLDTPKGCAEIVLTDGQNVTLRATFPSPPGSPLAGRLRNTPHELKVKVHGCRRIAPTATPNDTTLPTTPLDCFEIHGRWVSLTRAARELLLGLADR